MRNVLFFHSLLFFLEKPLSREVVGIYYGERYLPDPTFNATYKRLHNLGGTMMTSVPSKESVLSLHPDFVFSAYPAGDFLASKGLPTRDDFHQIGAQVYGLSGDCTLTTKWASSLRGFLISCIPLSVFATQPA